MRQLIGLLSAVLPLSTLGCSDTFDAQPTAPSIPLVLHRYTVAEIGDVIQTHITTDDIPCDFGYYCKYFEVTVPGNGTFEVGLTHAPGRIYSPPMTPIDMWVSGPGGPPVWMDVHYPDLEAYARMRAVAGGTYTVSVVSYELPGVTFQLRFSLVR